MRYRLLQLIGLFVVMAMTSSCAAHSASGYEVVYSLESQHHQASSEPSDVDLHQGLLTIAMVGRNNGPYFANAEEGAREAATHLNVEIMFDHPEPPTAQQQIEVVEQLIKKEVDVIAISAIDPEKLIPVLVKAQNHGIRVVTWDADTMLKGRDFFVNQVDTEALGRHLMDNMAQAMGETGKFVVLSGTHNDAKSTELLKWIEVQADEYYPDMKLELVKVAADLKSVLTSESDIEGVIDLYSMDEAAAAETVKQAGKAGNVIVTGLYSPSVISKYLRDGSVQAATLWSPKKLGYVTVALANGLASGIYPTDGQDVPGVGTIRMLGNTVIMDEPIDFTRENVNQYDF
jgi:rhamnose transport system substrate-binding protein